MLDEREKFWGGIGVEVTRKFDSTNYLSGPAHKEDGTDRSD